MRSLSMAQLRVDLAELERLMEVERQKMTEAQVNHERLIGAANYIKSNLDNMGAGTVKPGEMEVRSDEGTAQPEQ